MPTPITTVSSNIWLLAADNSPQLLALLRSDPSLASEQDAHGYSLMHAAASYNHLDLLRQLVNEFDVNVDLKDEDGETALFVVETMECAKLLVEELHADVTIRGMATDERIDGRNAREAIEDDGEGEEASEITVYLRIKELERTGSQTNGAAYDSGLENGTHPPPVPEGIEINIGSMDPEEDLGEVVDLGLRRRIEEMAARDDFDSPEVQQQLHDLVTEAMSGVAGQPRGIRRRHD